MNLNRWIAISVMVLSRIACANHTLNATAVSAHDSFWDYEGAATGEPEFTCDMTTPHTYAIHTDPAHPNRGIAIDDWSNFNLPGNETITAVFFNAVGRYTQGSTNCRFRAQALGTVQHQESYTEYWNQNNTSCDWRWPGLGWQITPPAGGWTADAVRNIDIVLWRRTVDYNGPSPDWARIDGFQLYVQTTQLAGSPLITGLDFEEDDGSYGYYFEDDETSHSFRITNVGNGQLAGSISGSGDNRLSFAPSGYALQPGQHVDITASFGCGQGGELFEDDIQLGSGNITLWFMADCEAVEPPGEGVCEITGLLYDSEWDEYFHVFQEGETTHIFQITNTGDGVLSGTIDTPLDDRLSFSVSNYSLQPGQGMPVTVMFQGGSEELDECCIEVSDLVYVGFYSVSSDLDFDTDPYEFPETELGQVEEDAFTVYNYGSGAFHGTVVFSDPSGSFNCPQAGNPFTVPPMTNGEPGEYTITVYFVPMVEGDFACTLSLCAECDPLVIAALALNPNTTHAAPVEPGEPTGGSSSESHGNFWGENDYSIPGFGGSGPEVVLAFHAEAVLTIDLVLVSPGTPELGLALLNGASPDSCIAVAVSQPDGTHRLEWVVEPGEYYLVLDGNVESFDYELMVAAVGVQEPLGLGKDFTLLESYPNPFNPTTTIRWMQPETGSASLAIFNILGGVVHQAELGLRQPGLQDYTWDASSLSTGAYFVQVRFQGQTQLTKVLLLK
jgi:hypothetical protein